MVEGMCSQNKPPYNPEAEMSVLGSILLDNEVMDAVLEVLSPDDFYRSDHRQIFQALIALWKKQQPMDLVILRDYLKKKDLLDEVGGAAGLATLVEATPTAANATYYARIVSEKALWRRLIGMAVQIARWGYDEVEIPPNALLDLLRFYLQLIDRKRG